MVDWHWELCIVLVKGYAGSVHCSIQCQYVLVCSRQMCFNGVFIVRLFSVVLSYIGPNKLCCFKMLNPGSSVRKSCKGFEVFQGCPHQH